MTKTKISIIIIGYIFCICGLIFLRENFSFLQQSILFIFISAGLLSYVSGRRIEINHHVLFVSLVVVLQVIFIFKAYDLLKFIFYLVVVISLFNILFRTVWSKINVFASLVIFTVIFVGYIVHNIPKLPINQFSDLFFIQLIILSIFLTCLIRKDDRKNRYLWRINVYYQSVLRITALYWVFGDLQIIQHSGYDIHVKYFPVLGGALLILCAMFFNRFFSRKNLNQSFLSLMIFAMTINGSDELLPYIILLIGVLLIAPMMQLERNNNKIERCLSALESGFLGGAPFLLTIFILFNSSSNYEKPEIILWLIFLVCFSVIRWAKIQTEISDKISKKELVGRTIRIAIQAGAIILVIFNEVTL